MKLDAHQHFWVYNKSEYGWISEEMSELRRDYLPEDLNIVLKSIDFDGAVVVQARQHLDETQWLLELAKEYDFIKGVVGWVDLCSPNVIEQLKLFGDNPYLKGIRHVVHDEPDARFMLREDFQRGISALHDFGLTYDLLIYPRHLPCAIDLVKKFPEQPFVLDHIGKPDIKNKKFSPWKDDLLRLAAHDHVYVKLSGMVTEASWENWRKEDFKDYLDIVFQAFGPNRIMVGSDWPVCTVSNRYETVMGIVLDYVDSFAPEYKDQIFGENCARFYHISSK
ncbi:amidohydrolase family protein [Mesobacillus foraminis]|uniref:amidohydrolase family protein n=1 Tax=Mesobacillus foraminis TaxID=279826 RepID=UPI000EF52994|nr:amidohydrolase family protein [Mesobacillus foraminis]